MSSIKPIVVYGNHLGPNPVKVKMILEELELPYETVVIDMAVVKQEPYTSINPNGRLPAITDPNTGITIWESGAIIEYLIDRYDTGDKISYDSFPEKYHLKQWLHFQMSGQGPYFGQLGWFLRFHPEDVPSAKKRYAEQTVRVFSVLDRTLKGREYLVGDKATYADIAFMTWDYVARILLGDAWNDKYDVDAKYPDYAAWAKRVGSRPVVAKFFQSMTEEQVKMKGN
ncbi:URE2 protein [Colletotrichum musicola]|uniref:URE2 protein n=1 Tax=Colletotrichum musicola TaxID=2175873 RepID=A0A8H6NVU6_9PEZI|nr:URE2 protein [Colletotrichum musicola]